MKAVFTLCSITSGIVLAVASEAGEPLYNGIVLPADWPPKHVTMEDFNDRNILPDPPYLDSPPAVIPIDVGRQLFVDDFLIEKTTLTRCFHQPEYHEANPVFGKMAFSGGVWHDPEDGLFKMWYNTGGGAGLDKDHLYFYVTGRHPDGNTVGLAILRRDGFASMDATDDGGTLTTRLIEFKGRYLFVNVDNPDGELRVEVLDKVCKEIPLQIIGREWPKHQPFPDRFAINGMYLYGVLGVYAGYRKQ